MQDRFVTRVWEGLNLTPEKRAQAIAKTQRRLEWYLLEGRAAYIQLRRVMKNIESRYAYGITQNDIQAYDRAEKQLSNLVERLSVRVVQYCRVLQKLEDGQAQTSQLSKSYATDKSITTNASSETLQNNCTCAERSRKKRASLRYKPYGRLKR